MTDGRRDFCFPGTLAMVYFTSVKGCTFIRQRFLIFAGVFFVIAIPLVWATAMTFTTHTVGSVTYDQAKDVRPFDLDEDGDIDFLAVTDVGNRVSWFRNNGSQSFTEVTIDSTFTDPYSVIGFNADVSGGLDVAACSADSGDHLTWYSNDGTETFTEISIATMADCTAVHNGDLDGDGDQDLVTGEYSEGDLDWWENSGTGSFTRISIDSGLNSVWDVFVYDIDDDADKDIIVADFGAYDVLLFTSNGANNPTFTKSTVDGSLDQTHSVFAADVDLDGDKDILATGRLADDVVWYENNGSESFTKHTIDADLDGASDVTTGDLDGDGDIDVTAVGQFANDLVWYDNNGSQSFTKRNIDVDFESAYRAVIYNVDGDSDSDIVVTGNNNNTDNITWFENIGDLTAPTATPRLPADNATSASTTTNLIVNFDETVRTGTGSMTIKLASDDSTVETITTSGSLLTASGTTALVFNPVTTLSDSTSYYVNWTANAFKDTLRNHTSALASTTGWNFTTGDNNPPNVTGRLPLDNATDVAVDTNLVITFDQITRAGTGTLAIKLSSDNSTVETITVSGSLLSGNGSTEITLNPSTTLGNNTSYYINWTANAFKDVAKNHSGAVTSATAWNFTTVAASAGGGRAGHDTTQGRINEANGETTALIFSDTQGPSLSDVGIATQTVTTVMAKPLQNKTILSFMTLEDLSRKARTVFGILADRLQDNIERFARKNIPISAPGDTVQPQDTVVHLERARRRAEQRDEILLGAAPVGDQNGFLVSTVLADTVAYADVPLSSWFAPYVASLVEDKIAHGYEDENGKPTGIFGVGNAVTRAESLKMVMLASGIALEDLPPPRNRSAQGTWASAYVAVAEEKNLSVFTPATDVNAPATRGEIVQMILELSGIPVAANAAPGFTDVPSNHPYGSAIATAAFYGLVSGDDAGGTFRPDDPINRAEVSKIAALVKELMK